MGVRIVILKGSPRKRGNSSVLADQVAAGAAAAGAEVDSFYLHGLNIRPCKGCDGCVKTGVCVIKDDMRTVGAALVQADAVVLASPVYWFTYSAQLKTCIDRWYALWHPRKTLLKGRKIGVVLAYGDSDLASSGGRNALAAIKDAAGFLGAEIAGTVHGSLSDVGDAEKNTMLMKAAYRLGRKLGQPVVKGRKTK
jgi:multimeric flavodoxin WrbA